MPTVELTALDTTLPRVGTKTERRWLSILLRRAVTVACEIANRRAHTAELTLAYLVTATDMPKEEQDELLGRIGKETR